MLAGLMLPAVQSAREAGRRAQCLNNERNVALALLTFENGRNYFPGWRNYMNFGSVKGQASWVTQLLPLVEQTALYEGLRDGTYTGTVPTMPIMLCPSGNSQGVSRAINYVANCGAVDDFTVVDGWTYDYNAYNGVFLDQAVMVSNNESKRIGITDIAGLDGTSNTLLLSENANHGFWISTTLNEFCCKRNGDADPPTSPSSINTGHDKIEGSIGFCWARQYEAGSWPGGDLTGKSYPKAFIPFQRACTFSSANFDDRVPRFIQLCVNVTNIEDWYQTARPSSNHPGTVIISFCDGSTRPLSDNVSEKTFVQLMTGSDKNCDAKNQLNSDGTLTTFIGDDILNMSEL
jgi:hypothetical protein